MDDRSAVPSFRSAVVDVDYNRELEVEDFFQDMDSSDLDQAVAMLQHRSRRIPPFIHMYIPLLLCKHQVGASKVHLSLALLDSGNTLATPCMSAKLHKVLGLDVQDTIVTGKTANQQSLDVVGISQSV